ncbi:MAG: haloacid dehalogenase-like hydrolase, partial [Gammaproteobacteria bacterium]|nr:haloacid dehalogenase-like hydrolase [Gammaproteobacteria bacterium]NIR28997.1 haloacid dehalogenase-like hydrolase [Gammaproteobacteria bacterium]NIR97473.1 haloacid dehalogenase-like hydrolase [Gammaproteobacteria bacterium]NIT63105.1 haloacid dehalogenase-like hydrolase [Gammaproteobacteria bacterium]NIV20060.1 haloacid dehalogenase-like hydrolase [Gammaproteobacteria bacterium]
AAQGLRVEHFIISSGIREMIEGAPIAHHFREIFASSFIYDHHGVAQWPALALNYTTKTQYLFRINKGVLAVDDDRGINEYLPRHERPVPFENLVFIGDGDTDVPCMRLVKDQGGHAIAVYRPRAEGAQAQAARLIAEQRVDFIAPADYRKGRTLDRIVHGILAKVAADHTLRALGKPD